MNENMDLKQIEKKAWISYFQDGLWDIFVGLLLLNFGIAPLIGAVINSDYSQSELSDLISYSIILIAAYIILYCGKKYITAPRLGRAKFSTERKSKTKKTTIVFGLSALFGLLVFILIATDFIPFKNTLQFGAIAFGINAIIVFSAWAYFFDFNRLYLYGWFFAASILLVELSRPYVGITYDNVIGFGVFGGIIVLIGIAYLIRFLQKYSLPTEETYHGE